MQYLRIGIFFKEGGPGQVVAPFTDYSLAEAIPIYGLSMQGYLGD